MTSTDDSIAVIIPCYNNGHYLSDAIESILGQTHKPSEIVIVDDGSNDDTKSVAQSYGHRVQLISQTNRGISCARNTGIRHTSSKFLNFLDADDMLFPDALETMLEIFNRFPDVSVVFGLQQQFYDWSGRIKPLPPYIMKQIESVPHERLPGGVYRFTETLFSALLHGSFIAVGGAMVRRDVFSHIGCFDEALRVAEDRDMWLRASAKYPFVFVKKDLIRRRFHDDNLTGARHNLSRNHSNVRISEKILSMTSRKLGNNDKKLLRTQLTTAAGQLARHYVGVGEGRRGRSFAIKCLRWSPLTLNIIGLVLLSFLPDRLLRYFGSVRKSLFVRL